MVDFSPKFQEIPFRGGIDTLREKSMLDFGDFFEIQNMRARHSGFEQRKGQIEQNTVADPSTETMTLYQFSKGRLTEIKLYRQLVDGSVQLATNNPPTVTTGAFGTDKLAAVASAKPASWSEMDDIVVFSDSVRQHQLNGGSTGQITTFIVYKGSAAIPDVPDEGEDFSREVKDGDSTTVAILDSLDTLVNFDAIFVKTNIRINALNFTIPAVNGNASVLTVAYSGPAGWTNVSGQSDGTASSGATMGQTGTVSWTLPTDEEDRFQFGESGFWYRLVVSLALDAEVEVSAVTYESEFQGLQNVFDGILPNALEVIRFNAFAEVIELAKWTTGITSTSGISEASDGTVWLCSGAAGGAADVFHKNADGTAIASFDLSVTTGDGTASSPLGVAVDPSDGTLWFVTTSAGNYFIFHTTTAGALTGSPNKIAASVFALATTTLNDIDVASDGTLWVLGDTILYHLTASGTLTKSWDLLSISDMAATFRGIAVEANDKSLTIVNDVVSVDSGLFLIDAQGDPVQVTGKGTRPTSELDGFTAVSSRDTDGKFWTCFGIGLESAIRLQYQGAYSNLIPTAINIASMFAIDEFVYFSSLDRLEGAFWEVLTTNVNSITNGTFKVEAWRQAGWTETSNIADGTDHFTRTGFITWDRGTTDTKRQFKDSKTFHYWYRLSTDTAIVGAQGSLFVLPYFDIKELGKFGNTNTVWNNRAIYSFDFFPVDIYASAIGRPMVINGLDAGILERPGDGRLNKTIGSRKFDKDLLIWQEEKGIEGGTITKYTNSGSTLADITTNVLSNEVGALNNKAIIVVEGVIRGDNFFKSDRTQFSTIGFCISRDGVFATDGITVVRISDRIQNFFDPTKSEVIRKGFEDKHWLSFNSTYNVLRMGLVSGSSASIPNKFFVYDLRDKVWMTDILGQALSFAVDIEAASGDIPVLSIGGGADSGKVYILDNSDDDVSTAIDAEVIMELGVNGFHFRLVEEILMMKAQAAGDITRTIARNTNTSFATSSLTIPMTAKVTNDALAIFRDTKGRPAANHLSMKWRNNVASQQMYLEKLLLRLELIGGTRE